MPLSNDRDRRGADRKIEGCSDIHATSIENIIILLFILFVSSASRVVGTLNTSE